MKKFLNAFAYCASIKGKLYYCNEVKKYVSYPTYCICKRCELIKIF